MNMQRENLVRGEIYVGHWDGGAKQVIFVVPGEACDKTFFIDSTGRFRFGTCCTGASVEFRHASEKEKLRLLTLLLKPSNEERRKLVVTVYKNSNPTGQEALRELFPDISFISKKEAEEQLGKIIID